MIKSKIFNIKISGIACAVPVYQEDILITYSPQFGEDAVKQFIKLTGVSSRHVAIKEQTASDLAYEAAIDLIENK